MLRRFLWKDWSVELRESPRARHFRLVADPEKGFVLTVPRRVPPSAIAGFLEQSRGWMEKRRQEAEKQAQERPRPAYETGDQFYYLGEPLRLEVNPSPHKRPSVKLKGYTLMITLHHAVEREIGKAQVRRAVETFFKKKAGEVLFDRLSFFNEHYDLEWGRVTFRNQKSRWGSCSARGNLNFNWRLIMAPVEVIDYVVVHELCHLRHMNHSAAFWACVAETVPDHKERRRWLKENRHLLSC